MTKATTDKCACETCVCSANGETAVKKDGKAYCSDACADGHPKGAGCGHTGCACDA